LVRRKTVVASVEVVRKRRATKLGEGTCMLKSWLGVWRPAEMGPADFIHILLYFEDDILSFQNVKVGRWTYDRAEI
jgi:hypothetical protein